MSTLGAFDVEDPHFVLYPNPANRVLNYVGSPIINNIELFDLGGNSLRNINQRVTHGIIDLGGLINDLYFVKTHTTTGLITRRLIVN